MGHISARTTSRTALVFSNAARTIRGVLKLIQHSVFNQDVADSDEGLCAVCHDTLRPDRFGLECRACRARWWHLGRLERAGHEALVHGLRIAASPLEHPLKGRPCPGCALPMSVVHPPAEVHGVPANWSHQRVDVCNDCDVVWLDPDELEELF